MSAVIWFLIFLAAFLVLAALRWRLRLATGTIAALLVICTFASAPGWRVALPLWLLFLCAAAVLNIPRLRRRWLTGPVLRWFRKAQPRLSAAERTALAAGTVGWEGELFSGRPDWQQLERLPQPALSSSEQAFIAGPLQTLLDNIGAAGHAAPNIVPLDEQTWQHLRTHGFFGLAIPQRFGGLGFSAHARSCILARIASAPGGATLGPIVATANGLGPAQLLLAYGTEAQQNAYLPQLASGEHLPCFAITSRVAGTSAAAVTDSGIVCEQEYEGERVLGLRLNWRKRHITLAPVATLLGLLVQVHDPERLLGGKTRLGLTCMLVDATTPGIDHGLQQKPVGAAFPYGPSAGTDVFVPLTAVIGGARMIGQGWRMILESLPAGRALATPSAAAGVGAAHTRMTSAYCRVRHQFGRPIGSFDGIEAVLARIGGNAYACEALRRLLANAVDLGERPAITAGIGKYHATERAQQIVLDSMTVLAGKAVSAGPSNPAAEDYVAAPLNAAMDGTNIFTRSLLIFGQGGIRCHPFLQAEMSAAARPDPERALRAFDPIFMAHVGHFLNVTARSLCLGLTHGRGSRRGTEANLARYYQRINRYAAALALCADLAMATLGRNFRHRENISARLGDVLSQLYIASATLQRYRQDGAHRQDLPFVAWVCEHCFADIEAHLDGILQQLPQRVLAHCARLFVFPRGRRASGALDAVDHQLATVLQTPGDTRDRLTSPCHVPANDNSGVALFDHALKATIDTVALRKRLRRARARGAVDGDTLMVCIEQALAIGLLEEAEAGRLRTAVRLHDAVIQVDAYAADGTILAT